VPYPYLDATLDELPRGTVVADLSADEARPPDLPPIGWELIEFRRPPGALQGNKLAYWRCLEVAANAEENDALVFEDDLEFSRNAVRRMSLLPVPEDLDWIQFFAPHVLTGPRVFPGLWRPPSSAAACFCQAIKFKRWTLTRLLDWSKGPAFDQFTASDQALNLARLRLGLRYAVHAPELVQHVGDVSAAEAGADLDRGLYPRTSLNFAGKDFDAMRLFTVDDYYR
jgi:hypothetical protein